MLLLTSTERAYGFVPGPLTFPVVATPYATVGLGVCWDRHCLWITRELARAGAQTVLMPVDDDVRNAQFPAYHAADSVVRAVEHRVVFATGTTSGISQVIDPYGRITAESGLDQRSVIVGQACTVAAPSLYTRYGDWFGCLLVVVLGVMLLIGVWAMRAARSPARRDEQTSYRAPPSLLD